MRNIYVLIILVSFITSSCSSNDDIMNNDPVTTPQSYKGKWKGVYSYYDTKENLIGDIFLDIDQNHSVAMTVTQYNLGTIGTWRNGTVSDDGILELDYNWGILSGKIINDSVSGIITPHLASDRPIYWKAKKL